MRKCLFLAILSFFAIVSSGQSPDASNRTKHQGLINRKRVASINGKPISFYLNNPKIDKYAKKFYAGELAISNNSNTYNFLDSIATNNSEVRPFYFFILNSIVDLSDADFGKNIAAYCLAYIEKYPCEFFGKFNSQDVDINIVKWTTYVGSGISDPEIYARFKMSVDQKITACPENIDLWKSFLSESRKCRIR